MGCRPRLKATLVVLCLRLGQREVAVQCAPLRLREPAPRRLLAPGTPRRPVFSAPGSAPPLVAAPAGASGPNALTNSQEQPQQHGACRKRSALPGGANPLEPQHILTTAHSLPRRDGKRSRRHIDLPKVASTGPGRRRNRPSPPPRPGPRSTPCPRSTIRHEATRRVCHARRTRQHVAAALDVRSLAVPPICAAPIRDREVLANTGSLLSGAIAQPLSGMSRRRCRREMSGCAMAAKGRLVGRWATLTRPSHRTYSLRSGRAAIRVRARTAWTAMIGAARAKGAACA